MTATQSLLSLALSLALSLPGLSLAESAPAADHNAHHPQTQQQPKQLSSGVYRGLLPCDDCYGQKTELALNSNGSYLMIWQYTGKSPRDYVEKGKFTWDEASNTVTLVARKEGAAPRKYLVTDSQLIQLDENGNRHTKQAERYVLNRTELKESSEDSHQNH